MMIHHLHCLSRVEGSTVTVASCIPIMQPLIELFFGKRALDGSSAQGKAYHNYGSDRGGNRNSDGELSSSRGGRQKKRDTAYDGTLGTLNTKDSQETILRQGQHQYQEESRRPNKSPYGGGIIRTDVFAVSYNTDSKRTQ